MTVQYTEKNKIPNDTVNLIYLEAMKWVDRKAYKIEKLS